MADTFTATKEMLRFIGWPRKTPEAPAADASGFGPDPEDPTANTRTII